MKNIRNLKDREVNGLII